MQAKINYIHTLIYAWTSYTRGHSNRTECPPGITHMHTQRHQEEAHNIVSIRAVPLQHSIQIYTSKTLGRHYDLLCSILLYDSLICINESVRWNSFILSRNKPIRNTLCHIEPISNSTQTVIRFSWLNLRAISVRKTLVVSN